MATAIADYDSSGYDYRTYWTGRDYEQLAEERALRRLLPRLGRPEWLVDFGGGFGRNAARYRDTAARYVIVDYSATNLANAARLLADDVAADRAFLVRADLGILPFVDAGFDAALVVRVLHHLPDLAATLNEMGRVVGDRWLLDVPIKHHALGVLRSVVRGAWHTVRGPEPLLTGTSTQPFWNFQLRAVRAMLAEHGWRTRVAASVNNLRRWDHGLPPDLVRTLRPAVQLTEALAQHCGRGWWGPSQFLVARRATPRPAVVEVPPGAPAVAALMCCPACRGDLAWTHDAASCHGCRRRYRWNGSYWDFTVNVPAAPFNQAR